MSRRSLAARAVVLASRPLGEADRIVRLFTREHGRLDAVARGVRRSGSRWGGRLEPFNLVDLLLYPGRSLYTVTQAQPVAVHPRLRTQREALVAAAVACEAAAGLTSEQQPDEAVFDLLVEVLGLADAGLAAPAARSPFLCGALFRLLAAAGLRPVLEHCAVCGGGGRALGFSAARGGLVCSACLHEGVPVTAEAVAALVDARDEPLAGLAGRPPTAAAGEALRHLHALYAWHTGGRLRSLHFASATD